jgi:sugar phosphate isomerase/epimerase
MTSCSRRRFVSLAAGATAAAALPAFGAGPLAWAATLPAAADLGFDLGIASYTLRAFTLDQAIAMTRRLRIRKITLKDMHLPMAITADEMASVDERLKAAGIQLSSCGVVYMTTEEQVHAAFAYAKLAGIKMMVGVPETPLLDLAERKVKETDISLAIHNHGPTDKRFPSPESAYTLIAKMDRRMGLCIDVGHTQRLGLDPAAQVERYFDRLLDVHIKDVSSADAKGTTVEIGAGVIDTPKLIRTLARLKYTGTLHFEHEKDEKDPFPGLSESVGYVRGVMAAL